MTTVQRKAEKRASYQRETDLGVTLRRLRLAAGLTLNALASSSGLATSTLSKIENGQMSPTYETILSLASGLGVDVAELFAQTPTAPVTGRRSITRKGEGAMLSAESYDYELLCSDIADKKLVPLLTRIRANSQTPVPTLGKHPGEEFFYVLSGTLTLFTEFYAPTTLSVGDSCYYDSMMGHTLVSTSEEPATILWICSTDAVPVFRTPG